VNRETIMFINFKKEEILILWILLYSNIFSLSVNCENIIEVDDYLIPKDQFVLLENSKSIPKINEWRNLNQLDDQKYVSKFSTNYTDNFPDLTRYAGPYDYNRVVLKESINGQDFIDASQISDSGNIVIATQCPLETTIAHFLQMLTDQKIDSIVMLTKTYEQRLGYKINKCEQYWPNAIDKPKIFEHMEITLLEQSEHVTNKLMERKLKVRDLKSGATQKLVMWHYLVWPDFGLPKDSPTLYTVVNYLKKSQRTVVHCSAGVGRTGTFIALSNLINLVEANVEYLNLFQTVLDLRKNRPYMVETSEQYAFLYSALANYIYSNSEASSVNGLVKPKEKET